MTALAHQDTIRESRVYRVNAWREYKGRQPIDFDAVRWPLRLVKPEPLTGWLQYDVFGKASHDWEDRKSWGWRASKAAAWLRAPYYLAGEVKAALRRSSTIPNTNSLRHMFPPPTAKQYREWEAIYTQKGR